MAKRRLLQEDDIDDMLPSKHAKVHGVITSISPMRNNTTGTSRYFSAELTDGTSNRRLVGFDNKVHEKLTTFHHSKKPVLLTNCEVKESRYSSDLEIVVRNSSQLQKSPVKFSVEVKNASPPIVPLQDLPKLSDYQSVSIQVKVTRVSDITVINELKKQECRIADATASSKIVLWENDIDTPQDNTSYLMEGLKVRTYKGEKYLSVTRDGFSFTKMEDLEDIAVF